MTRRTGMLEKALARTEKRCTRCAEVKPIDGFDHYPTALDRRMSYCKVCRLKATYAWRKANPEKQKIHFAKYRAKIDKKREVLVRKARLAVINAQALARGIVVCRSCKTEKPITEFWAKSRHTCIACLHSRHKKYYENNRSKIYETNKVWISKNKALHLIHGNTARNNRRRAANGGKLTSREWLAILAKYDHRCFYCRNGNATMEQEHMTPLSRGGSHSAANVVPACGTCNRRKHTKTQEEFFVVLHV